MHDTARSTELLARYVRELTRGHEATNVAVERPEYQRRLATAAQLFEALHRCDLARFTELLGSATRVQGHGFLAGSHGAAAEAALDELARHVQSG